MTSAHLAVVAVLVAAALALTAWWVLRARPSEATLVPTADPGRAGALVPLVDEASPGQPPPAPVTADGSPPSGAASSGPAPPSPGPTAGSPGAPAAGGGVVVVDVAGKVRRPGIASLPIGSRVADALKAAGGPRKGVDLTSLNLARVLVDGEQVVVGVPVPGGVAASSAADPSSAPAGGDLLVNVNTATQAQLEELPGIGPVTALAILQWRTENGVFTSVEELLEVSGIGEATLAEIAPFVTI
jgi:competence protein ComEA